MTTQLRTATDVAALAAAIALAPAAGAQVFGGPSVTAVQVGSGFSVPLDLDAPPPPAPGAPADDRLFVVEKTGRIRILHPATGAIEPTPFLDLSTAVSTTNERGLLGLAFDPNFRDPANRYFYVNYTDLTGATVIARYQVSAGNPNLAAPGETVLVTFAQDFANHNGGCLKFGPDGMLYASSGDGGDANDPNQRAQATNTLLGKILRLDVNNPAGGYIPAGNPFVGAAGLDQIWALGLRNPFRMSFDALTGDLYIGDVGQDAREEVDFQPAHAIGTMPGDPGYQGGKNYGWRCREGTRCTGLANCICPSNTYTDPLFEYAHGDQVITTIAGNVRNVTGGFVYRGAAIPSLYGMYVWAENGASASYIGAVTNDGGDLSRELDLTSQLRRDAGALSNVVSFGEDAGGELYLVSIGGRILKIVQEDGLDCGCDCYLTGCNEALFEDDFQTDRGWTTEVDGATSGAWQRGTPVDDDGWNFDPFADADGSGLCYLTQNTAGNTDVDNGSVRLISPAIDMTPGGITICYSYLLDLDGSSSGDVLIVEVNSDNGAGAWTPVRTHAADTGTGWWHAAITQADLDAVGIVLTSQMKVRFTANDANPQSVVEASVDGFAVFTSNISFPDCNMNCEDDVAEIAAGAPDTNMNGILDECETVCPCETDGTPGVDVFDLLAYLDLWFDGDSAAERTGDDPAAIDVFDLLAFLDCWFDASTGAPCP